MTSRVKIGGAPPPKTPAAKTKEVIQDQGSVPFSDFKEIPTPTLGPAKVSSGPCRGMGAMLRGGEVTIY